MSSHISIDNRFLSAPIGRLFASNVLPIMFVMVMSGLLNVVDAAFLGRYVGADALAAVSMIFPVLMITIALSALVSGGMASLFARHLGAGRRDDAAAVFATAHGLALCVAFVLIVLFMIGGEAVIGLLTGGRSEIAQMTETYLAITIYATPVQFFLGLHSEAWRNEGKAGLMALMSVGVTVANIVFNYLLIVKLDFGVAGSAWGTVLAQALGLALLLLLRLQDKRMLPLTALFTQRWRGGWRSILTLGAPVSLSFIGIALVSSVAIAALRLTMANSDFANAVAAYGVVTRIVSFAFLPLMAIALATQSIVGNNVGAGLYHRSDKVLRLAVTTALVYCVVVETLLQVGSRYIGAAFVADANVVAGVGAILRPMVVLYVVTGPVLTLALYFQAVGQPARSAALTLVKPFLLSPVLIAALAVWKGGSAIWFAFPVADALVAIVAAAIVANSLRLHTKGAGLGLAAKAASNAT